MASGFKIGGSDLDTVFVPKTYLFDRYPELADTFKQSGLWLWGYNAYGPLGIGSLDFKSSPVQTVAGGNNWKLVNTGRYLTAAIKTDGTLWLWGSNDYGELGDNTLTRRSSPVQTVSAGTNWKQVASGDGHTGAIKTDGTLWMWGYNNTGRLGINTTVDKSSPVQTISGGTNWKQIACGSLHTTAIKTDGTLWTWGFNAFGELGDNTTVGKSSPVQTVAAGTNWKQVSAYRYYTSAIKTDGTLWTWGFNNFGRLGDNTTANKSSPVQTVAGGTNWKLVSCGTYHMGGIKTDGTLWLWGQNGYGELGDNTVANKSSPIQTISAGTNWKQLSCGYSYTAAIKNDGTLWTWGINSGGQLGNNTQTSVSSPIQTISGGTNWKQVSSGYRFMAAIRNSSEDLL